MSVVSPYDVIVAMIASAKVKSTLSARDLWIRGVLSGGLLAVATMMAFTVAEQAGGKPYLAALVFPVSFVMIMLLGLELITGNFATMPMALAEKNIGGVSVTRNWLHVYAAILLGLIVVFVKAVFCNWLVTLGVVMSFTSTSTAGKILAIWLPIFSFFALGLEHCVVNMFVMPTAMLFGAPITLAEWWYWNQIPATLGNILGAVLFTALPLWWTYRPRTT